MLFLPLKVKATIKTKDGELVTLLVIKPEEDYNSGHIISTITSYGLLYTQRIQSEPDNWSLSGCTSAAICAERFLL